MGISDDFYDAPDPQAHRAGCPRDAALLGSVFVFFVTVLFVYDSIICTKEALAFGKSLEAMQKLRAELDNLQVQRALLRMNTEDRLQAAKEELLDQIEAKRVQAAALTGMSMEEFREKAGTKFKSIKEKPAAGMSLIQEKPELPQIPSAISPMSALRN